MNTLADLSRHGQLYSHASPETVAPRLRIAWSEQKPELFLFSHSTGQFRDFKLQGEEVSRVLCEPFNRQVFEAYRVAYVGQSNEQGLPVCFPLPANGFPTDSEDVVIVFNPLISWQGQMLVLALSVSAGDYRPEAFSC